MDWLCLRVWAIGFSFVLTFTPCVRGAAQVDPSLTNMHFGVSYSYTGKMVLGASYYLHTFVFPIPSTNPKPFAMIECSTPILKQFGCESLNRMIAAYNRINRDTMAPLEKRLKVTIDNLPKAARPPTTGKRRRRRSKVFVESPSLSLSRDRRFYANERRVYRRAASLGPDFCKGKKTESSGGLFKAIGSAGSSLFGLATHDDIVAISSHICYVSKGVKLNTNEIVNTGQRLASLAKTVDARTLAYQTGLENVDIRIDETREALKKIATALFSNANEILNTTLRLFRAAAFSTTLESQLHFANSHVAAYVSFVQRWIRAVDSLASGYLPTLLVPPSAVREVINRVRHVLQTDYGGDDFKLLYEDTNIYYAFNSIAYSYYDRNLYVNMKLPIYSTAAGLLDVFRVSSFRVPVSNERDDFSLIVDLPQYIGLTYKRDFYVEMDAAQFMSCKGTDLRVCPNERSLQRHTKPSCAFAVYFTDLKSAMRHCDFRYSNETVRGSAVRMTNGSYIVHGSIADRETWKIICVRKNKEIVTTKNACSLCMVTLPCFCRLVAKSFVIGTRLSDCQIGTSTTTALEVRYPVNLPVAAQLLPPSDLKNIKSRVALIERKWQIRAPIINLTDSLIPSVVEKGRRYSAELKKTLALTKKKITAYASESEALLAKGTEYRNELSARISRFVKSVGDVGGLAQLLSPEGIIGTIGASTVTAVLVFAFSCFNLWQLHRTR